jgi:hypothetical protein
MMECTPDSGRYHSVYSVIATYCTPTRKGGGGLEVHQQQEEQNQDPPILVSIQSAKTDPDPDPHQSGVDL